MITVALRWRDLVIENLNEEQLGAGRWADAPYYDSSSNSWYLTVYHVMKFHREQKIGVLSEQFDITKVMVSVSRVRGIYQSWLSFV